MRPPPAAEVRTLTSLSFRKAEAFLNGFTNYERTGLPVLRRGDLARMGALLDRLGAPQRAVRAVHVTGSKGKGTTCLVLESLLRRAGLSVGTYLSPHVESVTERIRIDGRDVSRRDLAHAVAAVRPAIAGLADPPTYFEILTGIAWWLFRDRRVDWAIVEAGIGGKNDATALLEPALCAVTSIELEHTAVLGRTEAAILEQKVGIARRDVPILIGPLKPRLRRLARAEARRRGAAPILWNEAIRFSYREGTATVALRPPLEPAASLAFRAPDRPFAINAALAFAAATILLGAAPPAARPAIERCRIPGRKELFPGDPPVLLDVAHTYHSLRALGEHLRAMLPGRPVTAVLALARDKNARRLLRVVEGFATNLVAVCVDPVRGRPAEDLAALSRVPRTEVAAGAPLAMERAIELAGRRGAVCACGSFVLVGQARSWLRRAGRADR